MALRFEAHAEALDFLETLQSNGELEDWGLTFDGELKDLEVRIYGPNYHGQFNGELARGIAVFQDEIYRATLHALNTMGAGQGRLSSLQKEMVELKVEVQDNCTLFTFDMGKFAEGLTEVLKGMPPEILAVVVVASVVVVTLGVGAAKLGGQWIDRKKAKDQLDSQQAVLAQAQQAETARTELHASNMERLISVIEGMPRDRGGAVVERFAAAAEKGTREIAVRATGATAVQVGDIELDADDLRELRRRAPRTSPEKIDVTEAFKIVLMNKKASPYAVTISGPTFGEFFAEFDESEFSASKSEEVYAAFKSGHLITLSVSVLQGTDSKIKFATIVDVEPEEP